MAEDPPPAEIIGPRLAVEAVGAAEVVEFGDQELARRLDRRGCFLDRVEPSDDLARVGAGPPHDDREADAGLGQRPNHPVAVAGADASASSRRATGTVRGMRFLLGRFGRLDRSEGASLSEGG